MNNGVSIEQLLQMKISDIRLLEVSQKLVQGVIDRQRQSVKSSIEEMKIDDEWAEKFLEDLE